jgi:UDP-glucose 4-epimerase
MSLPARIAVTGASGYLGGRFVRQLLARPGVEFVLGLDVKPPSLPADQRFCFVEHDVATPCAPLLRKHGIEAVVHLAFCFHPVRDRARATRVNVEGTRQVLAGAIEAGLATALYSSSGTAYGALPDNPGRLVEDAPLRAGPAFQYAQEKRLTDETWQAFARENPAMRVMVARPPVIMGPSVDNYLSRMIDKPIMFLVRGTPAPMQFIHEQDAAEGLVVLLERGRTGIYNMGPPDTLTLPEVAAMFGRRLVRLPAWMMIPVTALTYRLGLRWINEVPAGFLDYVRYPWVLDAGRMERELGWSCRYSSRQAMEHWRDSVLQEAANQ